MTSLDFTQHFSGLNLRQVRRSVKAFLSEAGIDTAAIDARLLLEHATGYSHSNLIAQSQDVIAPDAVEVLNHVCQRRLRGEPVDKILGYRAFYNQTFKVTQDVLSPRPETEGLVERAIAHLKNTPRPKILDLGTGSGAILISVLAELENSIGFGTDISPKALLIAKENAVLNSVSSRATFLQGSWFKALDPADLEMMNESPLFDVIISNPPYITDTAMTQLDVGVLNYDPDLALSGGEDGLDAYRIIIGSAQAYLQPKGVVLFEIGFDQGQSVSKLLKQAGYHRICLEKDGAGHDRIISAMRA